MGPAARPRGASWPELCGTVAQAACVGPATRRGPASRPRRPAPSGAGETIPHGTTPLRPGSNPRGWRPQRGRNGPGGGGGVRSCRCSRSSARQPAPATPGVAAAWPWPRRCCLERPRDQAPIPFLPLGYGSARALARARVDGRAGEWEWPGDERVPTPIPVPRAAHRTLRRCSPPAAATGGLPGTWRLAVRRGRP